MKKQQKKLKKLTLDKETIARLQHVVGGAMIAADAERDSEGPIICWISDCNPCETDICN